MADELYSVRNAFWCGCYNVYISIFYCFQAAIKEATEIGLEDPSLELERTIFLFRSKLALGQCEAVLSSIPENDDKPVIAAIAMEALILMKEDLKGEILPKLQEIAVNTNDPVIQVIAAQLYYRDNDVVTALRLLTSKQSLECLALQAQIYLSLNRVDKALSILKTMQSIDEDCALTQIVNCLYLLSVRGPKLNEVLLISQDLMDRFGECPKLYNIQAAGHLLLEQYEEALPVAQKAYEEDTQNPTTMMNLITCSLHLNKTDIVASVIDKVLNCSPLNPAVKFAKSFDEEFEAAKKKFQTAN